MSQYVNFYLKQDKTWVLLAECSQYSGQYKMIDNLVPYGKLVPLTVEMINEIFERISEESSNLEIDRKRLAEDIELIVKMPNPVDEKLEAIAESKDSLEDTEKAINYMGRVRYFFSFLGDIMETGKNSCNIEEFVWAGIEADPPDEKEEAERDE